MSHHIRLCVLVLWVSLFMGCSRETGAIPGHVPSDAPESIRVVSDTETVMPENVNEAGRVPVLMYHRITENDSMYDRGPEAFKQDLERLYVAGYRPVSLKNFIAGEIDVPAGFSPVIITFDDGDRSQYRTAGGAVEPLPGSALEIMESFRKVHPDFNPQATFFLNGGVPFGDQGLLEKKLTYLIERGYTVGNHTWGHEKLSTLKEEEITKTVGRNAVVLQGITGAPVELLAYPYGIHPKGVSEEAALQEGSWEGNAYRNIGMCNVGWQPEVPSYVEGFDHRGINRIRCGDGEEEAWGWLKKLDENPDLRYVSDGDVNTVTVPQALSDRINKEALGEKKLRVIQ